MSVGKISSAHCQSTLGGRAGRGRARGLQNIQQPIWRVALCGGDRNTELLIDGTLPPLRCSDLTLDVSFDRWPLVQNEAAGGRLSSSFDRV